MKTFHFRKLYVTAAIISAIKISALGDTVVYNNSTVDSGQSLSLQDGQTIGNQITLAGSGPYMLTDFSFEYYTPQFAFSTAITADVRFYLNNGPDTTTGYATPGSIFYDSGTFNLITAQAANGTPPNPATNVATIDFAPILYAGAGSPNNPSTPAPVPVPDSFTFTISLSGVGTNQVGLELFSPTTVGANDSAYWFYNNGSWSLLTNSTGGPSTIGARISAVSTPDQSSTFFLGIIGMTSLLGASKLRSFSKQANK
jgi:hypothetical protein